MKKLPGKTLLELKKDINIPGQYVRAGAVKTKKEWKKLFPGAFKFDTGETYQNHEWFQNKSLSIKKDEGRPNLQREIVSRIFSRHGLMSMTYKDAAVACLKSYKHHLLKEFRERETLKNLPVVCFVLFSIDKSQVTQYHGIVINDEGLAKSTCEKLSDNLNRFVDYYKTEKIYQTTKK